MSMRGAVTQAEGGGLQLDPSPGQGLWASLWTSAPLCSSNLLLLSLPAGSMGESKAQTLRWEPHAGRGFTAGGVTYRYEDGALQVNETGLYHVYSRVELTFKDCSPESSFLHNIFVRRIGQPAPMRLMEAHRSGFCSMKSKLPWTTESYLGSALLLQKLDRVYVNVSQPGFLRRVPYANFFGLYKIWRLKSEVQILVV